MGKGDVHRLVLEHIKQEAELKFVRVTYYKRQDTIANLIKSITMNTNQMDEQYFEVAHKGQEEVIKALYQLAIGRSLSKADRLTILYIFDIYSSYSRDWEKLYTLLQGMKEHLEIIECSWDKLMPNQELENMTLEEWSTKMESLKKFESDLRDLNNSSNHLKFALQKIIGPWKGQLEKCIKLVSLFANNVKPPQTSGA